MSASTIILIGPIGAGKSTLGQLLAEATGLPRRPLDDLRFDYYKEIGYDEAHAERLGREEGFLALYRYWKPFEIHAVERTLEEHPGCVIDFGGGHSVYEDEALFARAEAALAPFPNVILILPAPDLDESVARMRERTGDIRDGEFCFHEHFVKHPSNHRLAKHVVYTHGRTPEDTRDEILCLVKREA
jgi:shikimate kinase